MATQGYWHNTYFQQNYFEPHYWPGIFLSLGPIIDSYVNTITKKRSILSETVFYYHERINRKYVEKSKTIFYSLISKSHKNIKEN